MKKFGIWILTGLLAVSLLWGCDSADTGATTQAAEPAPQSTVKV